MSGTKGKTIASSLKSVLNAIKPQAKQLASEFSGAAKQVAAQQVQSMATTYLQQQQQKQMIAPSQQQLQPSVSTTVASQLVSPVVERLVNASNVNAAYAAATAPPPPTTVVPPTQQVVIPTIQPPPPAPLKIASGVALKEGIVAETIKPLEPSGAITHAVLKDIKPTPFYKKKWFIITIILILILILVSIGITIFLIVRARDKKNTEQKV